MALNSRIAAVAILVLGISIGTAIGPNASRADIENCSLGEIAWFAGNFTPNDWAVANGGLRPITGNEALFSVIGTIYGGDGVETFALPDLRGRTMIGAGQGTGLDNDRTLGEAGGSESAVLSTANLPAHAHTVSEHAHVTPAHTHGLRATTSLGTTTSPANAVPAIAVDAEGRRVKAYRQIAPNTSMRSTAITPKPASSTSAVAPGTSSVGSGEPFSLMQPYLAMTPLICVNGVFPTQ